MINSKKKGNRVELEIAKIFCERFGKEFCRVPQSGAFGTNYRKTNLREDAIEILSGDIITPEEFRFSIEVKSRKDFNFFDFFNKKSELHDWLNQCEKDADASSKMPLLIVKINYHETFVFIRPDEMSTGSGFKFNRWEILPLKELLEIRTEFFMKKSLDKIKVI